MVVLMEEFSGLSLKRKGAGEPDLFGAGGDGFPLSCRATKMRRLASPDGGHDAPEVGQEVDLPMGDAASAPAASTAANVEERAMVLYGGGTSEGAPRLRPCGAHLRAAGAEWVRAMLREADSRTVQELLAGAQEQGADLALALVPWVPPSQPAEEAEPSTAAADGEDSDGAAAMDVEEEDGDQGRRWAGQAYGGAGAGCGEGYVYRWPPQHCMAPPQVPAVGQASPVMWSW